MDAPGTCTLRMQNVPVVWNVRWAAALRRIMNVVSIPASSRVGSICIKLGVNQNKIGLIIAGTVGGKAKDEAEELSALIIAFMAKAKRVKFAVSPDLGNFEKKLSNPTMSASDNSIADLGAIDAGVPIPEEYSRQYFMRIPT